VAHDGGQTIMRTTAEPNITACTVQIGSGSNPLGGALADRSLSMIVNSSGIMMQYSLGVNQNVYFHGGLSMTAYGEGITGKIINVLGGVISLDSNEVPPVHNFILQITMRLPVWGQCSICYKYCRWYVDSAGFQYRSD